MATVKSAREMPAVTRPQNTGTTGNVTGAERKLGTQSDEFGAGGGPRVGGLPAQPVAGGSTGGGAQPLRRGLTTDAKDVWPRQLHAEEKDALDSLVRNAPTSGAPNIKDLLDAPAFTSLPIGERAGVLRAIATLERTGQDPQQAISSAAITARVLSPTADPHTRSRTLLLSLAVKPKDLDAFLSAHADGTLARADESGRTVLDAMMPLASDPVGPGVDRSALIGQVLRDVQDPIAIHQGKRNTCGATSSAILLARARPVEYARMLTELGGASGRATLPDGKSVVLVKRDALTDDSNRTITGRLLQPALMEFANGGASYDNRTEKHTRNLPKNIPGLTQPEVARLATALFGERYRTYGADMSVDDVVEAIIPGNKPLEPRALASLVEGKKPALALLDVDKGTFHIPAKGFHWVLVHEIKGGRVYFDDPNRVTNDEIAAGRRTRPGDYRVESDGRASMPVNDFARVLWTMVARAE